MNARPHNKIRLIFFAAWAFIPAILPVINAPAADTPATAPSTDQTQLLQFARWDILLNDLGLDIVKQANPQLLEARHDSFQPMRFNADALRDAVVQAQALNGVASLSQNIALSQIRPGGKLFIVPMNSIGGSFYQRNVAILQGNPSGSETEELPDPDHIHFKLDYGPFSLSILERMPGGGIFNSPQPSAPKSIHFDGLLAANESIAFLGDYTGASNAIYHHLIIWEVFKASPLHPGNSFPFLDPLMWCENGAEGIGALLDMAQVWTSGATHDPSQVNPTFQQKTEDGKTVSLIGLASPDKWPNCWWDADGQPINLPSQPLFMNPDVDPVLICDIEVRGNPGELALFTPTGHPSPNGPMPRRPDAEEDSYVAEVSFPSFDSSHITVGVPVGPWIKVGDIQQGASVDVDGTSYQLMNVQHFGDNQLLALFQPQQWKRGPFNWRVTLSVEAKNGTQLDSYSNQQIFGENGGPGIPQFRGISPDDVKVFHVWKRKMQWLSFYNLLAAPPNPPRLGVTPDQVVAAQEKLLKMQAAARAAKRARWEAIPPDSANPRGALRAIYEDAKKGDAHAIRAHLRASTDEGNPSLDLYAQYLTDQIFLFSQLQQRYPDGQLDKLPPGDVLRFPDWESILSSVWQVLPNGDRSFNNMTLTREPDGNYALDVTGNLQILPRNRLDTMIASSEKLKKLLADNPNMPLEQLDQAAKALLSAK